MTLFHLRGFRFRKVQNALERQNRDQQKKIDEEKRKVEEATGRAKEILRVSCQHCYCFAVGGLLLSLTFAAISRSKQLENLSRIATVSMDAEMGL